MRKAQIRYDKAGKLVEGSKGCKYEYDYENRLTKITRGTSTNIAEYTYDALGRRIEKKDLIDANNTRRYYYSKDWQVLADYNSNNVAKGRYLYGNYIDEVLMMTDPNGQGTPVNYYYAHDHLYCPVALCNSSGSAVERYEYDAYGRVTIWNSNFSTKRTSSSYRNIFYFTGQKMDFLDNGGSKLGDYKHRQYDYETGRFLQHDPLGIIPNSEKTNIFKIYLQYLDALNLYEYVRDNPTNSNDPYGLLGYWYPPITPPSPPNFPWQNCKSFSNIILKEVAQRLISLTLVYWIR